eukprot:g32254.t1
MNVEAVTEEKVLGKLKDLKVSKSSGPDGLHPTQVKEKAKTTIEALVVIFQASVKAVTTSAASVGCSKNFDSELMTRNLNFKHCDASGKGQKYLDVVFLEAVTPGRLSTSNS